MGCVLSKVLSGVKNINHKDRVHNFVALPEESVSSSWDRITPFVRSVPNHHIDDDSLKEYFYRGKMIAIRRYSILARVVLMVSALM